MKSKLIRAILCVSLALGLTVSFVGVASATGDDLDPGKKVVDSPTLNGWKDLFGPSVVDTDNAGMVWTDKSVFRTHGDLSSGLGAEIKDKTSFDSSVALNDEDNFLVALSAIGSTKSVTGSASAPTDTMIVLDLSSSMYMKNGQYHSSTVGPMIDAVNDTIKQLLSLNEDNRVGVVIYFGNIDRTVSTKDHGTIMLPLGRYEAKNAAGTFLEIKGAGSSFRGVKVSKNVVDTTVVPNVAVSEINHNSEIVAGTYIQLGIELARDQLCAAVPTVTSGPQAGMARTPVVVLMSDGAPTAASSYYYEVTDNKGGKAEMGSNTVSKRSPAETDFVTQLTIAYSKHLIDAHYAATKPLVYTLSLGDSISMDVMDPSTASTTFTAKINDYWTKLLGATSIPITATQSTGPATEPAPVNLTVKRIDLGSGVYWPSDISQQNYVDKNFTAATAGDLTNAFKNIFSEIQYQSAYNPTLVDPSMGESLSGFVEFYDTISEFMEVKQIEGILSGGILYSGEHFCEFLNTAGFGGVSTPTPLGDDFALAVRTRLGLTVEEARGLIDDAYNAGQLSYSNSGGTVTYSNYIGWWANEDGQYLGFWDGAITTHPAGARYAVKSYGVLGKDLDEHHGSEMLFSYIDVCLDVTGGADGQHAGESKVIWGVPASLLPTVVYSIELKDELAEGRPAEVAVKGEKIPIRLIYEVGLRDDYSNSATIAEKMAGKSDATAFKFDPSTATYTFYTNEWKVDGAGEPPNYGDDPIDHTNTTSYFEPSRENERYYFTADSQVYVESGGVYEPYKGAVKPSGTNLYFRHYMYKWTDTSDSENPKAAQVDVHYGKLSSATLDKAFTNDATPTANSEWFIPKGTYLELADMGSKNKAANETSTLKYSNYNAVGKRSGSSMPHDHLFAVTALGNNGSIPIKSTAGLVLTKKVDGAVVSGSKFKFTITALDSSNNTVSSLSDTYGEFTFVDGVAAGVTLGAGESKSLVGVLPPEVVKLRIQETYAGEHYQLKTDGITVSPSAGAVVSGSEVTVPLASGSVVHVSYTNELKKERDLLLTKKVMRGTEEIFPSDSFTFNVTMTGTAEQTFNTSRGGTISTCEVSTGLYGFSVDLIAGETIVLYDVPVDADVTVTEALGSSTPYSVDYDESDSFSDTLNGSTSAVKKAYNSLTGKVSSGANLAFGIVNVYTPEPPEVNIKIAGNKSLVGRGWKAGDEFSFQLEHWNGSAWNPVGPADSVTSASDVFDLTTAIQSFKSSFKSAGQYWFRVVELSSPPIPGIEYQPDGYEFVVEVEDDLSGKLHIGNVSSHVGGGDLNGSNFSIVKNTVSGPPAYEFSINTVFTNVYKANGSKVLDVPLLKRVENLTSDSSLDVSPIGFSFGLHKEDGTLVSTATITNADGTGVGSYTVSFVKDSANGIDPTVAPQKYYIQEIIPSEKIPGMTYDESKHWFELNVSDDGDGTLSISDPVWENPADANVGSGESLEFTNGYYPYIPPTPKAEITLSASKTLDGEACSDGKFTFELKDDKGNVVATASNGAGGAVSFGSLSFDKAGTYKYSISEKAGSDKKIEYDGSVYEIVITVTEDASGNLSATTAITKDGKAYSGTPAFANKTKYEPVDVAFGATKTLDGKEPGSNAFLFVLEKDGVVVEKVTNSGSGTIAFGFQTFDTEGVYKFTLSEVAGTDEGFEYDASVYKITVTVTKGEDAKLVAVTSVTKDGAAYDGVIVFNNKTVEKDPENPEDPDRPDGPIASTGDKSGLWLLVGIMCVSAAALVVAIRKIRHRA